LCRAVGGIRPDARWRGDAKRGVKYGAEVKREAVARVLAGESVRDVASSMGLSNQTVANWAAEERVRKRVAEEREQDKPIDIPVTARTHPPASQEERDFALAILSELEVDISPEMLRALLRAAKKVLL
jgi:transposase-like protein